jgi:hypothetical protein
MEQEPERVDLPPGPEVYAAVAARRNQFDSLLWQVPALSLAGQAFLFSVALAPDARVLARIVACALSLTITGLTLHLFARHRQGEIADAHWLETYEIERYGRGLAHGRTWQSNRNATNADAGWLTSWTRVGSFKLWSIGLSLFSVFSLVVLVISIVAPQALQRSP